MGRSSFTLKSARRAIGRKGAGWLAVAIGLGMTFSSPAQPPSAGEYEVKAGFLAAFSQFTLWPSGTFAASNSPVVFGVLGDDSFSSLLDRTVREQKGKRPLQVRRVSTVAEAAQCHVVFISKNEKASETAWLEALRDKPVLTVGESGQTLKRGGVVEFVIENKPDKRVRYDASWPAMERAGLKINAPMLNSARKVEGAPTTGP